MPDNHSLNDQAPSASQGHEHGSRKLLYVEDQPANLALIVQLISRHAKWKLLTAIDGNLGIILAKENLPDVILMDINLPGIDGFEVLRMLRADREVSKIPVIA